MAIMSTIDITLRSLIDGEGTTHEDRKLLRHYLDYLDAQGGPADDLMVIKRAEEIAHQGGQERLMNDLYVFGLELGSRHGK